MSLLAAALWRTFLRELAEVVIVTAVVAATETYVQAKVEAALEEKPKPKKRKTKKKRSVT